MFKKILRRTQTWRRTSNRVAAIFSLWVFVRFGLEDYDPLARGATTFWLGDCNVFGLWVIYVLACGVTTCLACGFASLSACGLRPFWLESCNVFWLGVYGLFGLWIIYVLLRVTTTSLSWRIAAFFAAGHDLFGLQVTGLQFGYERPT